VALNLDPTPRDAPNTLMELDYKTEPIKNYPGTNRPHATINGNENKVFSGSLNLQEGALKFH
jgi:hypothetical protein